MHLILLLITEANTMSPNLGPYCLQQRLSKYIIQGQIKKISVFQVTGLKILGRIGTHIFF